MNRHQAIGNYFRKKRVESGLTQLDVARHLGYQSNQMVSNWERGMCSPPLDKLYELSQLFDIRRKDIMDMVLVETKKELEQYLHFKSSSKKSKSRKRA